MVEPPNASVARFTVSSTQWLLQTNFHYEKLICFGVVVGEEGGDADGETGNFFQTPFINTGIDLKYSQSFQNQNAKHLN